MKSVVFAILLAAGPLYALDMATVKAAGAKAVEKGKDLHAACKNEEVQFCKGAKDVAAIKECLTKNKEKLSAECKTATGL